MGEYVLKDRQKQRLTELNAIANGLREAAEKAALLANTAAARANEYLLGISEGAGFDDKQPQFDGQRMVFVWPEPADLRPPAETPEQERVNETVDDITKRRRSKAKPAVMEAKPEEEVLPVEDYEMVPAVAIPLAP